MCVPDPKAPDNWPARLEEMMDRVFRSTFLPIDTPSGIKHLLLRSDKNFEWSVSYAVLRAAEIIALSKHLLCDEDSIRAQLEKHKSAIIRDMYRSKDFDKMLSTFLRVI